MSGENLKQEDIRSATDWNDKQEDYTTNEIAINWQSARVQALARFAGK